MRALIAALLLLAPLLPLTAQEAPPAAAEAPSDWYIGKPIKDVTFTGLAAVKLDELLPIVKPYVGQPFTLDLFDKLQNAIVALDSFERVETKRGKPTSSLLSGVRFQK